MEVQTVSVSILLPVNAQGLATFSKLVSTLGAGTSIKASAGPSQTVPAEAPKRGRGRPPKVKTADVNDFQDPEVGDDGDDFGTDGASDDDEELEGTDDADIDMSDDEEDEKPAPKKGASGKKELTLEGDVIPAMQKYAQKYSREKAQKLLLAKFKVKTARNLDAKQYPALLALLKV